MGGKEGERLDYPDDHIEVDNRLVWFIGRLDYSYGDDAFYVHLKRNKKDTSLSFTMPDLYQGSGVMRAYRSGILRPELLSKSPRALNPIEVAEHYYDTVNSNISLFLKDKSGWMEFNMENAQDDFRKFWNHIGAVGDFEKAMSEWGHSYNAGPASSRPPTRSLPNRAVRKMRRIITKLPHFVKTA